MKKLEQRVPNLRFKGFTNDWEQRKLGELYSYHNGKAHEQNQRSSGKYELINLNSISVDGTLKSSGRYINHADEILRQNDLVMILSDIAHGTLLGRVAIIPQDNKYVLNQRVALLRPISKSENSNFMAPLINNNQRYFHKMGIGTSQLNISKSTVIESLWQIPKIKEQSVIGNFLQNIDHIIALQQRKLELLKEIKKGLLQKMFADKDSKQPILRFKGFHDDWEQRKLGETVFVNSGKDYKGLQKGNIPVYGTGGYMLSVNKYLSNKDAIGIGRKGTINNPYILKAPFWTVDTLFYAIPQNQSDIEFMNAIFQNVNWHKYDESTGVPSLSKSTINQVKVYTTSLREQAAIGSLLHKIEKTISLQHQKLAKYQSIKKSLLQQMFI